MISMLPLNNCQLLKHKLECYQECKRALSTIYSLMIRDKMAYIFVYLCHTVISTPRLPYTSTNYIFSITAEERELHTTTAYSGYLGAFNKKISAMIITLD